MDNFDNNIYNNDDQSKNEDNMIIPSEVNAANTSEVNAANPLEDGVTNSSEVNVENPFEVDKTNSSEENKTTPYGADNNSIKVSHVDGKSSGTADGVTDTRCDASFYTETYRKNRSKTSIGLWQLILVAVISSIFGGGIVFGAFQFVVPAIKPTVDSYLNTSSKLDTTGNSNYTKIQIEKSDSAVSAIAKKVSSSIVGIRVTAKSQDFFFGQSDSSGEGSGIIIKSDGYILTNNHVIESAMQTNLNKLSSGSKIEVILPNQTDKSYEASVVGRDEKTDIAVLKIDATNLTAAELGDSSKLEVGEMAVAIGNPGGLEYMGSVTVGVISGLNRSVEMSDGEVIKLIQTDAAINPGNSGGALINSQGQVIGINSVKFAETGFEGMGFAIPINSAKEVADSLMTYKYVKNRPKIGVSIEPNFTEDVAKQYNVPAGLLVAEVEPLSAAYKAGIEKGDIITKFDGKAIKEFAQLESYKNEHKPGDKVSIVVYRNGKTLTLQLQLLEDKGTN